MARGVRRKEADRVRVSRRGFAMELGKGEAAVA
jgi:hypothetical protein